MARLKEPVAIIIDLYQIEEPIDLRFVLDLGDYLDAEEAYFDRTGEAPSKELRAASIAQIVDDLRTRSNRNIPQAA